MVDLLSPVPFPPVILLLAYILDLITGDPEWLPHPVRWIGRLISFLEKPIRTIARTPAMERSGGVLLGVFTVGCVYSVTFLILFLSRKVSTILFYALSVYIVWTCLSVRSLASEARGVLKALESAGLPGARKRLSRIVGRDTDNLPREAVLKATVETVSENTSDGAIAPLFFLALGGPPMMMAYKAVNTLDSMVGYKNNKYIRFGWFCARLDDAANYIPARISGGLMVFASFILGYNWRKSLEVLKRDGRKHPSPNSGLPEAAVAGALGLRLGGQSTYGGKVSVKPFIGDHVNAPDETAVKASIRIMQTSAFIMMSLTLMVRTIVLFSA